MNLRNHRFLAPVLLVALLLMVVPIVSADESYTVQPGDNLYRIALRYGLTVNELAAANGISNPNWLYTGQVLVIPAGEGEIGTAEETAGDGTSPQVDATEAMEHVVQAGETLAQIGRRYGVTVAALVRANRIVSPNLIYPGQRLQVPSPTASGTEVGAPPPPAGGYKQIIVDKSEQRAYIYQDGELLWTFIISTGMPGSETWEGTFSVRSKIPNAYAYNWGLQMPYWLGFYHTGYLENGFHALPIMSSGAVLWDGYLGTPVSYGCVILSYPDAETLYSWAEIGTEVIVRP